MKLNDDEQLTLTAIAFSLMGILIMFAGGYAIGKSQGTHTVETIFRAPEVHQGELPEGVPVMLYWIQQDGTIAGESAIRTTYQVALPREWVEAAGIKPGDSLELFEDGQLLIIKKRED